MDAKSNFLNGYIEEGVYVSQPPDLKDHKDPNQVYKLRKALHGLKQALRNGMRDLATSFLNKSLREEESIKTFHQTVLS